jgi:hypothetical protein
MKPVLCALDFSESSSSVMKSALDMAVQYKTSLIILFSYRLVQPLGGGIAEYRKNMESLAKQNFESLLQKVEINNGIHYEFRSEIGFLSDRIEAYVAQNKVGLVVMSQEMANGINDHKGLSLDHFLNHIKIPVLIVPMGME